MLMYLALAYLLPVKAINDQMQLVHMKLQTCLAVVPVSLNVVIRACDANDLNQRWQWIWSYNLRNIGTETCLKRKNGITMEICKTTKPNQKLSCSLNTIERSGTIVCVNDDGIVVGCSSYRNVNTKWRTSSSDGVESICNVTMNARDRPKWRRLFRNITVSQITSGLNHWMVTILNTEIFLRDVAGISQHLPGALALVSIAPNVLWGINGDNNMYYRTFELESFEHIPGVFKLLDFSMPGKGFVVNSAGQFCARLGITYENPKGSDWKCALSDGGFVHLRLSCGVTGCFSINSERDVFYRVGITDGNPVGTAWLQFENTPYVRFKEIAAGPSYELWATDEINYLYRRIGITDQNATGHSWERVPDILLTKISLGIFGLVGIRKTGEILTMNGLPTPKRQREMDELCKNLVSSCVSPGNDDGTCVTIGDHCHARYDGTPNTDNLLWRCYQQEALFQDGHIWNSDSNCMFTRHVQLNPLALKPPVLGSFEKQMWLHQACNDPSYNPNVNSGCLYHAEFDDSESSLVCRPVAPSVSCATVSGIGEQLFHLTIRASCGEIPLGSPRGVLADGAFSATSELDGRMAHHARLSAAGSAWCAESSDVLEKYLEVDFRFLHTICAVATQAFDNKFVRSYKLQYSSDYVSWRNITVFGSAMEFRGSVVSTDIIKHFLPTTVEARFFRIRPTLVSPSEFCLKIEVYGSSKETEAYSCEHYRTHLFATQNGFYNIYSNETDSKYHVYCKGLSDNIPAETIVLDENVNFKFYWPLNATEDEDDTLRTFRGRTGVNVLQNHKSKILGDFILSCISDPQLCQKGLTVELWLWFSCPSSHGKTVVLQSGHEDSAGFTLSMKQHRVCFEVRTSAAQWRACQDEPGSGNRWLHVAASWNHSIGLTLVVNDPGRRVRTNVMYSPDESSLGGADSRLRLGSPSWDTYQQCLAAVNSLSIWIRRIPDDEIEAFFTDGYILGNVGESCSSTCARNDLSCYRVMDRNIQSLFNNLGVLCGDQTGSASKSLPYVMPSGACRGIHKTLPINICCDCVQTYSRRLCRCEEPVNGSMSEWSAWSFCSRSCGSGRRLRSRSCTNPPPSYGGQECETVPLTMMEECHMTRLCDDTSGVLREVWLGGNTDFQTISALENHPTFPSYPSYTETLEAFESPISLRNHHGERLRTYFQPPTPGSYTFTMNCTYSCVLLFRRGVAEKEEIIRVSSGDNQLQSMSESSSPLLLTITETYQLEALHVNYYGPDYLAIGYLLDNGENQVPIGNEYLILKQDPLGVSREIWTARFNKFQQVSDLKAYLQLSPKPRHQNVLGEFATIPLLGDNYGQRLRAFFLAPSSGNYTFKMYCDDACALWIGDDDNTKDQMLDVTYATSWTWDSAKTEFKNLEGGKFYYLEVLHVEMGGNDYVGIGITLPDGTSLHPVNKEYLWREKPENIAFQRPAHQMQPSVSDWPAEYVVDGNPLKCSHTLALTDPWFILDMVDSVTVCTVAVTNRNALGDRLDDFQVRVGNSLTRNGYLNPNCSGPNSIPDGETMTFACVGQLTGRYLSIHIYGSNRLLTICELAVYGLIEEDGSLGQGLSDGRVEDYSIQPTSSSALAQYARLFHPLKSWCGKGNSPIILKIWFNEIIYVNAVATQGDPWTEKWVTKYSVRFKSTAGWKNAKDITGNQEFVGNEDANTVVVNPLMESFRGRLLVFGALEWHHSPCVRLEIYGKDVASNFLWDVNRLRNMLMAEFSGNETQLNQPISNVRFNTFSQLNLFGFNNPCLINPKSCLRRIKIFIWISLVNTTGDGFLFTTSNYNTSVVGFSLLVQNQEIVAIVRTETRVWRASGPAQTAAENIFLVGVLWSYHSNLRLIIGEDNFYGQRAITKHVTKFSESSSTVIKVGGWLDFSMTYLSVNLDAIGETGKIETLYSVDGMYSAWTSWSYCSKSCGINGVERRVRRCDNPAQEFGGRGCSLPLEENRACFRPSCEDNDGVLREVWLNRRPPHFSLKNITKGYSSHLEVVYNFSLVNDSHSDFGQRLRAFLLANQTGSFTFGLSCLFQCDLWVSPNDEAEEKVMLLSIDDDENSGIVRNVSAKYVFTMGHHYYIEVRSFEIEGGEKDPLLTIVAPTSGALGEEDGYVLVRHKPDCFHGLGMESGAIHDEQISSLLYESTHPLSYFGRLNGHRPWCVDEDGDDYLRIDLIELHWVVGVALQGYTKKHWIWKLDVRRRLSISFWPMLADVEDKSLINGNKDGESMEIVIFDRPLRCRYVVLKHGNYRGLGCLRLELIGRHAGNLATGKHTEQSSTYGSQGAFYANDGKFSHVGCSHTEKDGNPFLSIDLANSYYISEIFILQRTDCCQDRLDNFEVRIGDANATSGVLNPRCGGRYYMADITAMMIRCEPYGYGRYLTISILRPEYLTLCEVSVFQFENDTLMSNWSECSVSCGEGIQYRQSMCIKPYHCKTSLETRSCVAKQLCKIFMQNCRQLEMQGYSESGPYLVRPNPELENKTWVYCDHELKHGGWLVIQRRYGGSLEFDQSWDSYRNGFGNISTEFWIGNEILHQLTRGTAYEVLVVVKKRDGAVGETDCDLFHVSSEMDNYRLLVGQCRGTDGMKLSHSNLTEFSTRDADHGSSALNCDENLEGGWWYGSCDFLNMNGEFPPCSAPGSCNETQMMIRPNKVDGGWSHWTSWETCDKPCGGGNSTRVRFCTHPPPGHGGADCEGRSNESRGCYTHQCKAVELNITLKFTEEIWHDDLDDLLSTAHQELSEKITGNIKRLYNNDSTVKVFIPSFREGSVFADITILFSAVDEQQLVVLQQDLDQDGKLNQDMPVEYDYNDFTIGEVPFQSPKVVELTNSSSTSVRIQWIPPNATSVQRTLLGYRIYYKKQEDISLLMLTISVFANVLETEIHDLEPFTNYTVRLCAFSSSGNGLPSIAYHVKTDEDVPSQAPVITLVKNMSSTSFYLEWQVLDMALFHGHPRGYTVYYRVKNTTVFVKQSIDNYLSTNTSISPLMKYTEYELFMTAKTKIGDGVQGELMNLTTDEDVPSQSPSNITVQNRTSSSFQLSWLPIPHKWIHGILQGYLVTYWPLDIVNEIRNATAQPNVTRIELEGLRKFTNYTVRFAGMTSKGVGNCSEIIAQTDEDIPLRGPTNLTGYSVSANAINISWSFLTRQYTQGILIGYRLYYDDKLRHFGNVSIPSSQSRLILGDLMSYTMYNIGVAGFTKIGEGPRMSVSIRTDKGAPSRTPWDLTCPAVSSYTISLQWFPFTPRLTGSQLKGYALSYKMVAPPGPKVNFTLPAFAKTYDLEGLNGFAQFSIEMFVFNDEGRSNVSKVICSTEEGKPLAFPANVNATSNVGPDKIFVEWDHVPKLLVVGIRRGYTVIYKKISDVGISVLEEEQEFYVFDPEKKEALLKGLDHYSEYSIKVKVFNNKQAGDPSGPVYAKTCRCLSHFYLNWCSYIPYVNTSNSGIFPPLVQNMITGVCGNCSESKLNIHFDRDFRGYDAQKSSMVEVKQSISEENQVSFPVLGRKDAISSKSVSFLTVIDSPGSVFVTTKPQYGMIISYGFFDTILNTLPLLGFSIITASLAGIIMWYLESNTNQDHFPKRFTRGAQEGFWWAFVSMTTVGYGDRAPVTICGRLFAIMWTLYGLVITGLLVGNLTSSLTVSVSMTMSDVDLYQSQIAALQNSSEYKLGMAKGAFVNTAETFSDILSIIRGVQLGIVDGALLDMYVAASFPEFQRKDSPFVVKAIIPNPSSYGITLTGHASKLKRPFSQYLKNNAALVVKILEEYIRPVEEKKEEGNAEEEPTDDSSSDINVLAPDSPIILKPLLYSSVSLCVAVLIGLILHFTLCKRRRKADKSNTVAPVSDLAEQRIAMKECLREFCESSQRKMKDLKRKHKHELMAVRL